MLPLGSPLTVSVGSLRLFIVEFWSLIGLRKAPIVSWIKKQTIRVLSSLRNIFNEIGKEGKKCLSVFAPG